MNTNKLIVVGNIKPASNDKIHQRNFVYDAKGLCPTLTATMFKDAPRILVNTGGN